MFFAQLAAHNVEMLTYVVLVRGQVGRLEQALLGLLQPAPLHLHHAQVVQRLHMLRRDGQDPASVFTYEYVAVFRIRIHTDQHKDMPPGSGSAWTDEDPDPDPGGKKAQKICRFNR